MKKNNVILGLSAFLLIASLFTTGCGKEVKISKKAVVGFENGEISANDYYKEIIDNYRKIKSELDIYKLHEYANVYSNGEKIMTMIQDEVF